MGDPLWLRVFTSVESVVGPKVEDLVHGSKFATAVVVVQKVKSGASGVVERRTRRVWHLVNLPAASDVRRLRNQIGDLDHEVRLLRGTVESEARKRAREARRANQEDAASGTGEATSGPGESSGKDHGSNTRSKPAKSRRGAGSGLPRGRAQRAADPKRDQGDHGGE